jgi:hypothetical protein
MSDTDYAKVLTAEYAGREWTLNGNDYASLKMLDGGTKPSKATLDAKWPAVLNAEETRRVEAARRARYQAETDGMFFAAQRDGAPLDAWKAAVDQIKADLPYPEPPK